MRSEARPVRWISFHFAVGFAAACVSLAGPAVAASAEDPRVGALRADFQSRYDGPARRPEIRFAVVFKDLNLDGRDDAVLYGPDEWGYYCGTGGCPLIVLKGTASGFHEVGRTLITRPDVALLRSRHEVWPDLSVLVVGGGILRGYRAVLAFDGRRYPLNPTVPPARRKRPNEPETVLIGRDQSGPEWYPLWP